MKILFGMNLDGVAWSSQAVSVGEVRTGPLGLLGILETRLGLAGPSVHPVHRINAYMSRLKALDQADAWFHRSFSVDPWSTARQLLAWRDELIEAGWHGDMKLAGSPRLEALTALENMAEPLMPGRADRLRDVIGLLAINRPVALTSIQLMEPVSLLPPAWQSLFELLMRQGIPVSQRQQPDPGQSDSNLSLVQSVVQGASLQEPLDPHLDPHLNPQDDSLILLQADNEWEAAEHLALWLAVRPEVNGQVAIICGKDTSVLDQALSRHGLPRLGRSEPSRWREIQQLLPLVLGNAWQPVDIRLLAELLSLTSSPWPGWVCRCLLQAIAEEPGVDGDAWHQALGTIAARREKDLLDKGEDRAEERAQAFVRDIHSLLVDERFDPVAGIPEDKLRERCQLVVDWLGWQLDRDPRLVEAVSQARDMQKLSLGQGQIPRITLERMLDTVIGTGSTAEDCREEAGSWHVVDHPGQLVDLAEELVWWGFNDPETPSPTYWSDEERAALGKAGVVLEAPQVFRYREAFAWQNGLQKAARRLTGLYMTRLDGEEAYHHPFWDTILSAAAQADPSASEETMHACLVKACKDFDHQENWTFAGRQQTLNKVTGQTDAPVTSSHSVPESVIRPPDRLSYSQMNTLIGCPLKWALQYFAELKLPENQVIPTGNQMIGSLCHRIIQALYDNGQQWDAEDAGVQAGVLFDSLLPALASELLLEGHTVEKQRYRAAICTAVRLLTEAINRRHLTVEKTEVPLSATVEGIPFIGFADLLLRDAAGHAYVLDLKWSSSSKYRRQEIEEGTALQLATYAWMLRSADQAKHIHTGYFMLAQGQLISDSPLLSDEAINAPCSLEEVWNRGVASLKSVCRQLSDGLLEARGVKELLLARENDLNEEKVREKLAAEDQANGLLYQRPPCNFCDFGHLCGRSGGVR